MNKTSLLIIGATVLGTAAATSSGGDYVLLEEGVTPGWEFVSAFRHRPFGDIQNSGDQQQVSERGKTQGINAFQQSGEQKEKQGFVGSRQFSEPTKRLYDGLLRRNCISEDGGLHLFPAAGLLASCLLERQGEVHFSTVVTNIMSKDGGYLVEASGLDGKMSFWAERVLDTTSLGVLHPLAVDCVIQKSLCGMLVGQCEELEEEPLSLVKGRFDNEYILRLRLPFDISWPQARLALHEAWQQVWKRFPACRFTVSALEYDYEFDAPVAREVKAGWQWRPSVSCGNLFEAFEGGIQCVTHI